MKKILSSKYWWIGLIALLLLINWIASQIHYRLDLTAEKRYTISSSTKKLLRNLKERVDITVFLEGDMPAGFKKLSNSAREMLQEFKESGRGNIVFHFIKPAEGLNDSMRLFFMDSLQRLGLNPLNVKAQVKEGEGSEERFVYPGAVLRCGSNVSAVDFLQGQSSIDGIRSLNNAEALLEYKFANTISKISKDSVPVLGYLLGNGETFNDRIYDLINNRIKNSYRFNFLPIDSVQYIPSFVDAIIINKPTQKFSDNQKLKIDQYVMHGGKIMWMIDNLYAEMDSLQRSQNEFIAFDRGLNLEDLLFKYGVRINLDLVQDLNSDKTPSVVGTQGGKPQIELLPWPYFPIVNNYSNHPIAKNLDYILTQFPNSLDTVKAESITKTILLATSPQSRILNTPARIAWNSIENEEDIKKFNRKNVPIAVLLEGKFKSLYANRLSVADRDALNNIQRPFISQNTDNNKMIVVADGDIALNAVTQKEGPLQMGVNPYTKYQYANGEFVMNSIEFLVDNSGILETRGKDFTLRLLDKKKLEENKITWQFVNIILPLLLVFAIGAIYQFIRRRKYQQV
jgi:ABC-2 type transport system permease protein